MLMGLTLFFLVFLSSFWPLGANTSQSIGQHVFLWIKRAAPKEIKNSIGTFCYV